MLLHGLRHKKAVNGYAEYCATTFSGTADCYRGILARLGLLESVIVVLIFNNLLRGVVSGYIVEDYEAL